MDLLKWLWQDKAVRVYAWQLLSTLIMIAWAYASTLDETTKNTILVFWIPLLNALLKYFNVKYLWDAWVQTDPVIEDLQNIIKQAKQDLNK